MSNNWPYQQQQNPQQSYPGGPNTAQFQNGQQIPQSPQYQQNQHLAGHPPSHMPPQQLQQQMIMQQQQPQQQLSQQMQPLQQQYPQQFSQQQQQQFYSMSSSSSSSATAGSYNHNTNVVQQQQFAQNIVQQSTNFQKQEFQQQHHQQQVSYQQQQQQQQHPRHPQQPLAAGETTVVTSQMYFADNRRVVQQGNSSYQQPPQQPLIAQYSAPPSYTQPLPQQQQPIQRTPSQEFDPLANQNQLVLANPKQFYSAPNHGSFSSLAQSEMLHNSRPTSAHMSRSSSSSSLNSAPKTSLLSHADGSLMLQEIFIISGTVDDLTGYAHVLDLQGIWARVRSQQGQSYMRLALRMLNNSSSIAIPEITMQFAPNSFGLLSDPSTTLLSSVGGTLDPGQTGTCNLTLLCAPENQKIVEDSDLSAATINISYSLGRSKLSVVHRTFIPLHIFFVDHPQADPTNYVSDPDSLSCSDDGPRLTQTAFLSLWPSNMPGHQFSFENVNWKRWYTSYAQAGVLSAITGVTFPTATPSVREVLKVFERKLSTNRIYVVASREVSSQTSSIPNLVFFCSFKVGELPGGGVLLLGEIKLSGDDWSKCETKLKSTVNKRLWGGLERAVRAILLS